MRLDLRPSRSSELVPFQECSLRTLESCEFANAYSGVSEDGTLAWVHKGSILEVVSTSTGHRVASLNVEHLLRDVQASVICVCEFRCQGRARLLVAISGSAEQGMVVLLDIPTSMVVKAVEIPQQVTALECVLTYGGRTVPQWAFSEQLRQFYGIAAVGTEGGYVYLVDMSLDAPCSIDNSQKVSPCPLLLLEPRDRELDTVRNQAALMRQHLALRLGDDEQMNTNDYFHFRRPDLTVVQSFNEDEVHVSSLCYIPQSGTLAIGYNFGGFHLWKLFNPVLEYTSSVEPEDLPVAYFVYQEPENDPKNFAYLWVCRDDRISEVKQESLCSVSLYQLCYSRRTFYANYGSFYEELNSVALRLDHNLTTDPYNSRNTTTWSSQLLSAVTIADPNYHPPTHLTVNDSFDEGCQGPDLSLCAFLWEANDSRPGGTSEIFLSVFDMNRWYHAQMPARIKCVNVSGQEVCPYFAIYSMKDIMRKEGCGSLLDVRLKPGSLLRFINNSPMPPEQHFYPSSLAFETVCILSNGIISANVLGVQRQVLESLDLGGPACLLKPFDLYHRCIQTGLLARATDTASAGLTVTAEEQQRMSLLTLALEHGKIRFITACIRSWADGEFYQQGCTLQFLLSWAWSRVTAIKQLIDTTCQPLFDWSGAPVDQRLLQALHNCLCCLGNLTSVLRTLLTQSTPVTDQGQMELEHRIKVVTLLHHHLKVTLWFVHNGLLPEYDEAGDHSTNHYVYPASELTQVFRDRRHQMTQLHLTNSASVGADTKDMILIDALVHSAGDSLTQLWKNQGGSGMYPPPSLHAALSTYLLDNVRDNLKNAIILYLLFDMAAVARGQEEQFAEKIPLFAKTFELPLGLVQQIHGFWLIDHMNFEEGLMQLLRRGAFQELGPWQHTCVLRALLQQGQVKGASQYLSMRNPPVVTTDDLKMRLTIMVANKLVWQAVAYVRQSCGSVDQEDMLQHVFLQCQKCKLMELLFRLPLTDHEEQCLQKYLSTSSDSKSAELLVLHLVQRAQYVPAIRLNDRMKHRATMDMSSKARDRSKTRNTVVEGFRHALPATQQYLINNPPTLSKVAATRKIEVPRPKPLSTVITQHAELRAKSQSSLIMAVMDKVAEAGTLLEQGDGEQEMEQQERQPMTPHKKGLPASDAVVINEPGPFLCTPSTPKVRSHLSLASQVVFPAVKETTVGRISSHLSPTASTTARRSVGFTADCMSLLHTPKVDHTPATLAQSTSQSATPHSILKVSRLPRTSPRSKGGSSAKPKPKRLGFGSSPSVSSNLPPTPTELTPSSTPSPSPTTTTPPPLAEGAVGASLSKRRIADQSIAAEAVTPPRHIRFAENEVREISPAFRSPDDLARPPLHSPADMAVGQEESSPGEVAAASDEEITFNFSRNITEPMDVENEAVSSTAPLDSPPSPPPAEVVHQRQLPSSLPATQETCLPEDIQQPQAENEQSQQTESSLHENLTRAPLISVQQTGSSPQISPAGQSRTSSVREGEAAETEEESNQFTKISPRTRDRSPQVSPRARNRSPQASPRVRDRSPQVSPGTRSQLSPRARERSPIGKVQSEHKSRSKRSEREASPQLTSSARSAEVVKQTSVFRETRQTSNVSGPYTDKYEIRVVSELTTSSATETTVTLEAKNPPGDDYALLMIECEDGSQATPSHTPEAMETIEPTEENILMAARQARTSSRRRRADEEAAHQTEETVEIAADEETDEIQPPTPIRPPSLRSTPERPVMAGRRSRRGKIQKERMLKSVRNEDEAGETQEAEKATPPKLRRVSQSREKQESGAGASSWSDQMPTLRLEVSDDENSNENRSQSSSSPSSSVSSHRVTRRSSDRSSPSPPPAPVSSSLRRGSSQRKSVDRSPPPSPSRRSTRHSEERGATPERMRRSGASSDKEEITIQTESSSDEIMPPPPSPIHISRPPRLRTPERSSSRKASTSELSPKAPPEKTEADFGAPKSPSRRSLRHADQDLDEDKEEPRPTPTRRSSRRSQTPEPASPSRRSTRRSSRTPERSLLPAGSENTLHSSRQRQEGKVESEEKESEGSQSSDDKTSRRDQPEDAVPSSPSRRSTRSADRTESEDSVPASPSRRSTRAKSVEPAPASPSRRSAQSERAASEDPTSRTATRSDRAMSEDPAPVSPSRRISRSGRAVSEDPTPVSPTRRSSWSDRATSELPASASPSRRFSRSDRAASEEPTPTSSSLRFSRSDRAASEDPTPSSPTHGSTRSSRSESAEIAAAHGSGQSSQSERPEAADAPVSPSRRSTQASLKRTIVEESSSTPTAPPSPSRRSTRHRSKTPERSPARSATRLRGRKDSDVELTAEIKDIATATEEVRSGRKKQKTESMRAGVSTTSLSPAAGVGVSPATEETGDAPSFQFAVPTPLAKLQGEADFSAAGPSTDMSAFVFSLPITRSTRSHDVPSTSLSTSTAEQPSQSAHAQEEASVQSAAVEEEEVLASEADNAAGKRKGRRATQSRKKMKKPVPGSSPSNSPIALVSPGDESRTEPQPERGSRLPSRKSQAGGATRGRVLRKRKAKLW